MLKRTSKLRITKVRGITINQLFRTLLKSKFNRVVLCLLLIGVDNKCLAQTRTNLYFNFGLSDVSIKEIPSYIEVNNTYLLFGEGVGIRSLPSVGLALGLEFQKRVFESFNLYTGLELDYRRNHLTYYNNNLFFYENGPPSIKHPFSADIVHQFLMVQVPIGMMIPIHSNFFLDIAVLNGLMIKVWRSRTASDESFKYQLVSLEKRSTNQLGFELALGATFQTNDYTMKIVFTRGINTIESKVDNGYNQLIPADLYFMGLNISMQIRLQALFSSQKE